MHYFIYFCHKKKNPALNLEPFWQSLIYLPHNSDFTPFAPKIKEEKNGWYSFDLGNKERKTIYDDASAEFVGLIDGGSNLEPKHRFKTIYIKNEDMIHLGNPISGIEKSENIRKATRFELIDLD